MKKGEELNYKVSDNMGGLLHLTITDEGTVKFAISGHGREASIKLPVSSAIKLASMVSNETGFQV